MTIPTDFTVHLITEPAPPTPAIAGLELGHVEWASMVSTTATIDVPGFSVEVIPTTRPVRITLDAALACSSAPSTVTAQILVGGVVRGRMAGPVGVAETWQTRSRTVRVAGLPPAIPVTIGVRLVATPGSTARISGDAESPAALWVVTA